MSMNEMKPNLESSSSEILTVTKNVKKEKNPNRVAAGKKLAEYNRKKKEEMRQKINALEKPVGSTNLQTEHVRDTERTSENVEEPAKNDLSKSINFKTIFIFGIGFVVVGIAFTKYFNFSTFQSEKHSSQKESSVKNDQSIKDHTAHAIQNNIFEMT